MLEHNANQVYITVAIDLSLLRPLEGFIGFSYLQCQHSSDFSVVLQDSLPFSTQMHVLICAVWTLACVYS